MKLFGSRHLSWGLSVGTLALLGLLEVGCAHKIGDACTISTDCSVNGDRLCDTTQPDGYCTVFNCEPDKCPSGEGVCVAFTDGACDQEMVAAATSLRFQRTFCMKPCDNDGDCRAGYRCVDENEQTQLGARIVDNAPESRRVCMVPGQTMSAEQDSTAVCEPSDASFPLPSNRSDGGAGASDAREDVLFTPADAPFEAEGDGTTPDAPVD